MSKRVLIIQGHPDASAPHFCHALASSYVAGAESAKHIVRQVNVAKLEFPLLRSQKDFETGSVPPSLKSVQEDIVWAEHIVVIFPLWAGDMPALLKAFWEQIYRPNFTGVSANNFADKRLAGRSARVVVTMGMPALVYRWYFRAHSLKSLERNILGMVGIAPVHETLIGMAGNLTSAAVAKWLTKLKRLGATAS